MLFIEFRVYADPLTDVSISNCASLADQLVILNRLLGDTNLTLHEQIEQLVAVDQGDWHGAALKGCFLGAFGKLARADHGATHGVEAVQGAAQLI